MLTVHQEPDCGNAPRREVLKDLVVAIATRDSDVVDALIADDVVWTLVGGETLTGRGAVTDWVAAGPEVDELTFGSVLTHGRGASVDGVHRLVDESETGFSHVLRFSSTAKTAKISGVKSYLIDL